MFILFSIDIIIHIDHANPIVHELVNVYSNNHTMLKLHLTNKPENKNTIFGL